MTKWTDPYDPSAFEKAIDQFEEKTNEFYSGKMSQKDYKGFSGKFGSYAQRSQKEGMLRLRMNAGRLTKEKLKFVVDKADEYQVDPVHFTTCQTVQLHNLKPEEIVTIMREAIDAGIITYGGGGDYPRNVMASSRSGVDPYESFDIIPWAIAANNFMMHFIDGDKLPRKLKVSFANTHENACHSTFRDLGFVAKDNGMFDVYAAGGLGNKPRLGVLVKEDLPPKQLLYSIYAMMELFKKHGNYENRAKARTRYMVESMGGEEAFIQAYQEELEDALKNHDLDLEVEPIVYNKKPTEERLEESFMILPQKQEGLYSLRWHPINGNPSLDILKKVYAAIEPMEDVEIRLAPDETAWIINLNASEAKELQEIIWEDSAHNELEASVSCIGATVCQVGIRDSGGLLRKIIKAVQEAGLADDVLPRMYISGCPSSCGTHQVGDIGFRGFVKVVDKKPVSSFMMFGYGQEALGQERLGQELGNIEEDKIPGMIVELGKQVSESGQNWNDWYKEHPDALKELAARYV